MLMKKNSMIEARRYFECLKESKLKFTQVKGFLTALLIAEWLGLSLGNLLETVKSLYTKPNS